eukprot:TRINITY_DN14028_c0_g2_i3.p1 TRINITY_DN14028_c0_g2~~TRINITY_DN14028_c0_g2_i3.p1  ORF type:complete len:658 (-),score=180.92 TRINITY_DN14028_c0_g2_i3:158-2131(-)
MAPVTWDSASILSTIRRPWRVFEEDLEDKLADAGSQNLEVPQEVRDQLAAVQAKGAKAAFSELPEEEQRMYAEVSLTELAAFVCFQRKKAAQQLGAADEPGKAEALWDTMPLDDKAEWCPEDPRAVLAQESKWANLLADGPVTPAPGVVPTPTAVLKREAEAERPAPETKAAAEPAEPKAAGFSVDKEPAETTESAAAGGNEAAKDAPAPAKEGADDGGHEKRMATSLKERMGLKRTRRDDGGNDAKDGDYEDSETEKAAVAAGGREKRSSARVAAGSQGTPERESRRSDRQSAAARGSPRLAEGSSSSKHVTPEPKRSDRQIVTARGSPRSAGRDDKAGRTSPRLATPRKIQAAPKRERGVCPPLNSKKIPPQGLCPEAMSALCHVCGQDDAIDENDLGICDRCDRAFHAKCHEPIVTYFGRPEDQWFCAPCTEELAKLRTLRLRGGDFAWASVPADQPVWPVRVIKVDFTSLADAKPYWVEFFDSGPRQGAWVSDSQLVPWANGPKWSTVKESKRKTAIRLAEADGAEPFSRAGPAKPVKSVSSIMRAADTHIPGKRRPAPVQDIEEDDRAAKRHRSGRQAARAARQQSARKEAARDQLVEEEATDDEEEEGDGDVIKQVQEMRGLIQEARERQKVLEAQLADSVVASQSQSQTY